MKKATRAQVKTCCPKFQAAFGNFIDRTKVSGAVCIFRKSGAITSGLSKQIGSARPWAFGSEASTHKALAKNSSVLHNPLTREYPFTALHNLSTSESTYLAPQVSPHRQPEYRCESIPWKAGPGALPTSGSDGLRQLLKSCLQKFLGQFWSCLELELFLPFCFSG